MWLFLKWRQLIKPVGRVSQQGFRSPLIAFIFLTLLDDGPLGTSAPPQQRLGLPKKKPGHSLSPSPPQCSAILLKWITQHCHGRISSWHVQWQPEKFSSWRGHNPIFMVQIIFAAFSKANSDASTLKSCIRATSIWISKSNKQPYCRQTNPKVIK